MHLELSLADRVALVTGGTRGIGSAIAGRLSQAGCRVVVGSTRKPDGPLPDRMTGVHGDLADRETPARYVAACHERHGRLDILVNNAGLWEGTAADVMDPEILRRTLAVNLESAMVLTREALPLLRGSRAGRIINISSTASLTGEPGYANYAASKGGLDAYTRSLAVELGPENITANGVAPGWTETEMSAAALMTPAGRRVVESVPLRKVAVPDDIAYAVVFLASDWAGHISGVTLPVDGAFRFRR